MRVSPLGAIVLGVELVIIGICLGIIGLVYVQETFGIGIVVDIQDMPTIAPEATSTAIPTESPQSVLPYDFAQIEGRCDGNQTVDDLNVEYSFVGTVFPGDAEHGVDSLFLVGGNSQTFISFPAEELKEPVDPFAIYYAAFHITKLEMMCLSSTKLVGMMFFADKLIMLIHESNIPRFPEEEMPPLFDNETARFCDLSVFFFSIIT